MTGLCNDFNFKQLMWLRDHNPLDLNILRDVIPIVSPQNIAHNIVNIRHFDWHVCLKTNMNPFSGEESQIYNGDCAISRQVVSDSSEAI